MPIVVSAVWGPVQSDAVMGGGVHPIAHDSADVSRTLFKDGAVMEYDRVQHHWRLAVPAGGKIVLEIGPTRLELSDQGARLTAPQIDLN